MVAVKVMDLDATAEEEEEEERWLNNQNEAEDARFFIGFDDTHGYHIKIDIVASSGIGTDIGSTSSPESVPDPDAGGSNSNSNSNSKKRSKCWND
jgi:hypothetical protein